MPIEEFIINVFCLIDDLFKELFPKPLRTRGFEPKLTDSEVITLEIVGEWLGYHKDKDIWQYFRRHWLHLFPNIPARTKLASQGANLWAVKQKITERLVKLLGADMDDVHLIDGFPIEVCNRARAKRRKIFNDEVAYGYCASKKKPFFGFQGHLLISMTGIPVSLSLTPANIDERDAAYDLIETIAGLLLGDKGYIRPIFKEDCKAIGIDLQTPLKKNMKDSRPKKFVKLIMRVRRRVETVIGQLAHYFDIEHSGCRNMWHMTARIARKLLAYNVGVFLNVQAGKPAIQFENLIAA